MLRSLTIGLLALIVSFSIASGQDAHPDLTGLWRSVDYAGITYQGTHLDPETTVELDIADQNGPTFSGAYRWYLGTPIDQLHDGTEIVNQAEETIVGVLSVDRTTLIIAEHPDTTYRFGRLTGTDTMELLVIESGPHALAVWMVLERE